jgi:hypothetical protein
MRLRATLYILRKKEHFVHAEVVPCRMSGREVRADLLLCTPPIGKQQFVYLRHNTKHSKYDGQASL